MTSTYGYLTGAALGLTLTLAFAPAARAQTTTYGVGSCMGTNLINGRAITGKTQLFVGDPNDTENGALIPGSYGDAVFNKAECQCQSRDIRMHFILTSSAGAGTTPGTAMYVGQAGCEDPSMRSVALCDQVTNTHPANNASWSLNGDLFKNIAPFDVVIPPEVVTNPKSSSNYTECSTSGAQNYTITVTVGPDTQSAVCTLPVVVNTQGPQAPQGLSATTGDSGLNLSWSVPDGTSGIKWYQVLCRKQSAATQPAMTPEFLDKTPYYFSACIDHRLYRQKLGDLKTGNDPADSASPALSSTFQIDPRLRCSDKISPATTQMSTRLSGLENGETYEVMVVSIDSFGNPTPSEIVTGTPQANVSVLNEYCQGENCPGFGVGCQAGRGTPPLAGVGAVLAMGLVMMGLRLARRARRAA